MITVSKGRMWLSRPHETTIGRSQFLRASLLLLSILAGCSSKEEKPAPPPPGVTVTPVVKKDVDIRQEWVGTMIGNVDAEIRPKVDGFLLSQLYKEGSYVTKGKPLFQLDRRQAEAAVQQAEGKLERTRASLAQAQIDVKRYTPLVAQRAVSQAELDKAQSLETSRDSGGLSRPGNPRQRQTEFGLDNRNLADLGNCGYLQGGHWRLDDPDYRHDDDICRRSNRY